MEMTELEFKIYSNALVEIGKIIGSNDKTLEELRFGNGKPKCIMGIRSYLGAGCPFDFIIFDRVNQRFSEIEYEYSIGKNDTERRKIAIPEYLGSVEYI